MEIYGLTGNKIKRHSLAINDFYVFLLGDKFRVTMRKKENKNNFLSDYANMHKTVDDKIVIRYYPSNAIFFKKSLVDNIKDMDKDLIPNVSMNVDNGYVYIGKSNDYPVKIGVLVMSGVLSANNLVEKNVNIYFTGQNTNETSKNKIKLLSVGLLKDDFYGIIYVPKERGFVLQDLGSDYKYYSVKTWNKRKSFNADSYEKLDINDWFASKSTVIDVLEEDLHA